MIRRIPSPATVERHDDGGLPAATLAALEREAAHLTRRDGRRRLVVLWEDGFAALEIDHGFDERGGPQVLTVIDLA